MFLSSRNKTRRFTTRFIHHGHRTVHYGRRGGLTVFSLSGHPYGNECYMPRASNSRARCNGTTVTSLSHFINCNIWRCGMTHWQSRQRYYVVIMLIFYRNFEIPIRLLMSRGEAGNPRGVINSEDRGLAKTSILAALTFTLVAENDNFIASRIPCAQQVRCSVNSSSLADSRSNFVFISGDSRLQLWLMPNTIYAAHPFPLQVNPPYRQHPPTITGGQPQILNRSNRKKHSVRTATQKAFKNNVVGVC